MATSAPVTDYRDQLLKVEPKGIEPIAGAERHGRTRSLFSLWFGANVEFATLVTGVLATAVFGLSFPQAVGALALGNVLGAVFLGLLSTFGPRLGVPQLVQSRGPFGYYGNFAPGALNFIAGFSWFAVNTVLGVFALDRLAHLSFTESMVIMVAVQVFVAVLGHNLIHAVEKALVWILAAVFLVASIYGFSRGHLSAPFSPTTAGTAGFSGAFIATVSVALSYVLGWVPYASDYTRYLPETTSRRRVFLTVAGAMVLSGIWLEVLGAAMGTAHFVGTPGDLLAGALPHTVALVTLVGVVIGTVTANVLNIYSGALSSLVLDIPMPRWLAAVVVGAAGTVLSFIAGRHGFYSHYETFLFLLGYWISPWMAIVALDVLARPRAGALLYDRRRRIRAGFVVWVLAVGASVPFMNQAGTSFVHFVGPFAASHPSFGDITYYVGFAVATVLYSAVLLVDRGRRRSEPATVTLPADSVSTPQGSARAASKTR